MNTTSYSVLPVRGPIYFCNQTPNIWPKLCYVPAVIFRDNYNPFGYLIDSDRNGQLNMRVYAENPLDKIVYLNSQVQRGSNQPRPQLNVAPLSTADRIPINRDRRHLQNAPQGDNLIVDNRNAVARHCSSNNRPSCSKATSTPTGLCVIIVNYTDDLPGYIVDVETIQGFFSDLGYDVIGGLKESFGLRNLTPEEMRRKLSEIVNLLTKGDRNKYDRLALFVTSCHGTLAYSEDPAASPTMDISAIEILGAFQNATCLASIPKLFFFQGCKGSETPSRNNTPTYGGGFVPPGSNVLVYQSTNLGQQSIMLPQYGSWLIHNMIEIFQDNYKTIHLRDMLRMLTNSIKDSFQDENGDEIGTYQLPTTVDALGANFFRSQPEN